MKTLKEEVKFNCSADELWAILSDIGRCDWVPTIEKIVLEGDLRHFEMTGMGQITEKIIKQDQWDYTSNLIKLNSFASLINLLIPAPIVFQIKKPGIKPEKLAKK